MERLWKQIYRVQNAVHQGFKTICEAVGFLLAGDTFNMCTDIAVYDEHMSVTYPKDFGHVCKLDERTS